MTLNFEIADRHIRYDPESGDFFRKTHYGIAIPERKMQLVPQGLGYLQTRVGGYRVKLHQLAWLLHHREMPSRLDHVNGIKTDNRMCNLRIVTPQQNSWNRGVGSANKSGVVGVRFSSELNKWLAQIKLDGKNRHLGCFETIVEATRARRAAEANHFGEFARQHGSAS